MIRNLLFDLDNTLLDFSRAERIAISRTLEGMGIAPTEQVIGRYSALNLARWKLLEQGKIGREEVKVGRFRLLFEELGFDGSPEEAARRYEELLAVGHYFIEGAPELLEALCGKYRMYLVTNGTASVAWGRIGSAGIGRYFEGIFISEEIGFDKPSPAYFTRCFARMGDFRREETVIVGDSLTSDIQGGQNAGIHTAWFNPRRMKNNSPIQPEREFARLLDLPALLEDWRHEKDALPN